MDVSRARRLATPAAVILGMWIVAGVLFGWHNLITQAGGPMDLRDRVLSTVLLGVLWTLSMPLVFAFSRRFPIRPPWRKNLLALPLIAVAFAALRAIFDEALLLLLKDGAPSMREYWNTTLLLFHSELLFTLVLIGLANFLRIEREAEVLHTSEVRLEAQLAQARLHQLRGDLHPHFLFNTLNAIAAFVRDDPAAAERMVVKLSELLRASVASQHARVVPLEDELQFIDRYLDIQKLRFGGKLVTSVHVLNPHLQSASVPPLLLQPLVENSILHGIGRRASGGRIEVVVDTFEGRLRLQVRDDGPGCDPATIFERGSLGVPNAQARLETLYGSRYSFRYRRSDGRFIAEVLLPLELRGAA